MAAWLSAAGTWTCGCSRSTAKRYVGAQIGIYNPPAHKVGKVSHLRNTEYVFVAGSTDRVEHAMAAAHAAAR